MLWLLDTVSRFDRIELFDRFLGVFGVVKLLELSCWSDKSLEFTSFVSLTDKLNLTQHPLETHFRHLKRNRVSTEPSFWSG
jgi:hypothetical protein